MSKATKRNVEKAEKKAEADSKKEGDKGRKEKFKFGPWDSILLDFLTELQESQVEADRSKSHFTLFLPKRLRKCKGLADKVKANANLAERIVNSLPCGHRHFYEFIREVRYTN